MRIIREIALVLCVLACVALGYSEFVAPQSRMPEWVAIESGPVAHGFDKFYRSIYVKGNIKTAGDLTAAGDTELAGTLAITGTVTFEEATGTITATQTLTPTATYYKFDPAADMTVTLSACTTEGVPLILHNTNITYAVTISSTNCLPAATNVISLNDLYVGLCNGTSWVRFLVQDN